MAGTVAPLDLSSTMDASLVPRLTQRLSSVITGVSRRTRTIDGVLVPRCFAGSEAVDWIVKELQCTRPQALDYCDLMYRKGTVMTVSSVGEFKDASTAFYRFNESEKLSWSSFDSPRNEHSLKPSLLSDSVSAVNKALASKVQKQIFTEGEQVKICTRVLPVSTSAVYAQIRQSIRASSPGKTQTSQPTNEEQIICVTVKGDRVRIHLLKEVVGTFSVLKTWPLEDFKLIDVSTDSPNALTLAWDKPYHFETVDPSSIARTELLWVLLTYCNQHSVAPSTSADLFSLQLRLEEEGRFVDVAGIGETDEFKELMTAEEEKEILELLETRSINEVTALSVELKNEVHRLEAENINELIAAHNSVKDILDVLSKCDDQREIVGSHFTQYKATLSRISHYVEQIENKNNHMDVITKNLTALHSELKQLIQQIELPPRVLMNLEEPSFDPGKSLQSTTQAAKMLETVLTAPLLHEMDKMLAVKQQRATYKEVRDVFLSKFVAHIGAFYVILKKQYLAELKKIRKSIFKSKGHASIIEQLAPYQPLVLWAFNQDTPALSDRIHEEYRNQMTIAYKVELKYLFKSIIKNTDWKHRTSEAVVFRPINTVGLPSTVLEIGSGVAVVGKVMGKALDVGKVIPGINKFRGGDIDEESWSDDSQEEEADSGEEEGDTAAKQKKSKKMSVDKTYHVTLARVLPMIHTEQDFIHEFFEFDDAESSQLLAHIFEGVTDYLIDVITYIYKLDPFFCLTLFGQTHSLQLEYKKDSGFIASVLERCQSFIRTLFGTFIESQCAIITASKIVNIKRVGVLEHVKKTIQFIDKMNAFGSVDSDSLATPAYQNVLSTVFRHILSTADIDKNDKAASKKMKLIVRFENFHHLYHQMEAREISSLNTMTAEAKRFYEEVCGQYVAALSHDIYGHLDDFFSTVDELYNSLRPDQRETIQYEDGFTNRVLSKLISKFPLSHIDKGLYREYKKMHYNLSREEGLLHVVWDRFKEHMVKKHEHFEFLVSECYRNQKLSFSSADLQKTFGAVESRYERKYGKDGMIAPDDSDSDLESRMETQTEAESKAEGKAKKVSALARLKGKR